jgi:DNA replication and repair protein RecF
MALSRLTLTQFRNYADVLISPRPGFVVLTGENGAGKTNVLEAVSLLAPGRGLRGASLSEMARTHGPGGFGVAARLQKPPVCQGSGLGVGPADKFDSVSGNTHPPTPFPGREGEIDIGTGTSPSAPERRQVRINGVPAPANALAEWLSLLWLTPAMDRLFVEGASGRRRFLDRLVLATDPAHAGHSARYEAAMRARNRLLADSAPDASWLTALETQMAEHGAAIGEARERTLAELNSRLASEPEGPFARAALAIEGWGHAPAEALAAELRLGRARDIAAGRTLTGPHRSDLAVTHLGKGQRASRCSTGEQKALLLAILLAHAGLVAELRDRRPILLLDEIAAHLDPLRRAALFDRLAAGGGQVWMTGTEPALFKALGDDATWLGVEDGKISAA